MALPVCGCLSACLLCVLLAARTPAALGQTGETAAVDPRPVVATVNGEPLTEALLQRYLEEKWGRAILGEMIDDALVRQAASQRGIAVSETEIDVRVERAKAELGGVEAFNAMLRERGITHLMYRSGVKTALLLERLMDQELGPSEQELRAVYEAHAGELQAPARVRLHAIVTENVERAYTARQRVAAGEEFARVALQVATPRTRSLSGDRGWLLREDIEDPLLREVAFGLAPGQISNPVRIGPYYHVLHAAEVEPARAVSFEQARDEIAARLAAERRVAPEAYLMKLRRLAAVEVQWPPYVYLTAEYRSLAQIRLAVDGATVRLDTPPQLVSGRMIGPAKPVLEAVGAAVTWEARARTLKAQLRGGPQLAITADSATATLGRTRTDLGAPAQIREGVLWAPLRPLIEALGGRVHWDEYRYTLFIWSPATVAAEAAG